MKNILTNLITIVIVVLTASSCSAPDNKEAAALNVNQTNDIEQTVSDLIEQMTLQEKLSLIHAAGTFHLPAIERLGIKETWMSDGPHGVRQEFEPYGWGDAGLSDDHSTYLPHLTTVAASWDKEIARKHGHVLGAEARHRNKDFILGPGVNMARVPINGRNFEYMGEDPYLIKELVVPQIKAIQANDVAATIKHYALNTQELNRAGVNATPDDRTLREIYLPAFEYAVKEANVLGIMGAYNQYMGTNANQSKHLIMDILKGEWGFNGALMTDWNVDINTYDAAMNGLDIEMGTRVETYDDYFFAKPLEAMIAEGKVPETVIDDKVRRILRVQHTIGMYKKDREPGARNTVEHRQTAREIAEAGVILLKNDKQLLPLKNDYKNILVLGPNSDAKHGYGGGSSEVKSEYEITPLQGLKNWLGNEVSIRHMRVRSDELSPIAADYITERHWTGTPAWHVQYYADAKMTQSINESWIVNSEFNARGSHQYLVMKAKVKALETGVHTFKMQASGDFRLFVDDQEIMADVAALGSEQTASMNLQADTIYNVTIEYKGQEQFVLGWDTPTSLFDTEAEYLEAAEQADLVIYYAGLNHAYDREAIDRDDMKLPDGQDQVISKLLAINPNTIIFMVAGSPVEMPWINQAHTLVWGWYGGMEAGNAFANIMSGAVNPSGKLPFTLPVTLEDSPAIKLADYNPIEVQHKEGVFIGYRWHEQQTIAPLFPFGYGLSYTNFEYSDLQLSSNAMQPGDTMMVTTKVTNTGKVAGAEIVQLYLHDHKASVDRPYKELKGFQKVYLMPGESKTIHMELKVRDLSFWDIHTNDWLAEPGDFTVIIASSSDHVKLTENFTYQ